MALFNEEFLKKLEYLHIVSRKVFSGQMRAERPTKKLGAGVEFADHRDYAPGDDFRYLDWNIYGRLDRLLVRLFQEDEELYIYILLDASASMLTGRESKFDQARRVVCALAYIGLANLDRVGIVTFTDNLREEMHLKRGKSQIFSIFDFLEPLKCAGITNLEDSVRQFVHRRHRRGIVIIASDFFDRDGYEGALKLLGHHGFSAYVVHMVAPEDRHGVPLGDIELVDIETDARREITINETILDSYMHAYDTYADSIERFCLNRGFGYVRTQANIPFQDIVLKVFRRGGFVK